MLKTKHGEFNVNAIEFGERREMHRLEMKVYWKDEFNQDAYFNLLNYVMNLAFDNPSKALANFDDVQIDEILNDIYTYYKSISKKKK
mgnify:FL=1|jgi:hypothetical protein|tara:strand:- start:337 stop:597 length:261 start_codon:yes stop_codon:yes gene_type:complete